MYPIILIKNPNIQTTNTISIKVEKQHSSIPIEGFEIDVMFYLWNQCVIKWKG